MICTNYEVQILPNLTGPVDFIAGKCKSPDGRVLGNLDSGY